DIGDRWSNYCVLDEAGEVLVEQKVATTPEGMKQHKAVNRRVASSNLARGANFLSVNELAAALFQSLATVVMRSTSPGILIKRSDTYRTKTQCFLRKRLSKARPLRF